MPNYLYAKGLFITVAVAVGGLAGLACTDNSGNGPGNPGAGGTSAGVAGSSAGTGTAGTTGTGGTGGTGGTSSGGSGGTGGGGGTTPGFMSVKPCTAESQYVSNTTTINFPTSPTDFSYSPKCLKVPAGTTVTFSGDFGMHPLEPSANRGAQTGNPITLTSSTPDGGTKDFTFSTPGFYAYYCAEHDLNDSGNFMDGVVWVQ
jgi:plastocyanin